MLTLEAVTFSLCSNLTTLIILESKRNVKLLWKTFTYFYLKTSCISSLDENADPCPCQVSAANRTANEAEAATWVIVQANPQKHSLTTSQFWILLCGKGEKSGRWGCTASQTFYLFIIVALLIEETNFQCPSFSPDTQSQYIPFLTFQGLFIHLTNTTSVLRERVHKLM